MTDFPQPTFPLGSSSSQALQMRARRLAAYLPQKLTRQILQGHLPEPGLPHWLDAATMFADISGFTRITEELAADGPRGAEELNRTLFMTFTALINAVHDAGGVISHFHGDAMMIYFPDADGQAAERALAAARFMQGLMLTSLSQVTVRRSGQEKTTFTLTVKIGLAYGRCLEMVVGSQEASLEFVLGGTAVDQAVRAQEQALAGQVVAAQSLLSALKRPSDQPFQIVEDVLPVPPAQPGIYWDAFETTDLRRLTAVAQAFVSPALIERLQNPGVQFVGEHRTVTSMFVQFSGIDFDDDTAGSRLQVYYQWACAVVKRYGGEYGRVNRILTGDKGSQLHILFGAPVAPDAPAQAVRCALALQQEKPRFINQQRIALTAGRAFAGALGSQNRREYTAVGAVINLSARMTNHCPDGAVVIDEATAYRVWSEIELESLPSIRVKGREEPVTIYQVNGDLMRFDQTKNRFAQWNRPLLGLEKEQAQVEETLQRALAGSGKLVVLQGPFGSGQEPLLAAAVRYWQAQGGQVLAGRAQANLADSLYVLWQPVWRDLFGLTPEMAPETAVNQVLSLAAAYCPECAADLPLWPAVLSLRPDSHDMQPLSAPQQKRFGHLVQQTVAAAAGQHPLLIILEDVQRANAPDLDLLNYVLENTSGVPLCFLVTVSRPSDSLQPLLKNAHETITLGNLPPDQARKLVKQQLGLKALPRLLEQYLGLRDRQGQPSPVNPLFLDESLRMMLLAGALLLDEDVQGRSRVRLDEAKLAGLHIPDSVYGIILARLDQLSPQAHGLLQIAAVVGREFDLPVLTAVAPEIDEATAVPLLQRLVAADLLQPIAAEPEPVYHFPHSVLHNVVYQSVPFHRRQAIHRATVEYYIFRYREDLKPWYALLAYHYGQTEQNEAGLQFAMLAADDARAVFAHQDAAALYRQALAHLAALGLNEHWETAVRLYASLAETLYFMGQLSQAAEAAAEGLALSRTYGPPARVWPLLNLLADIRLAQGAVPAVWSLTEQVIDGGRGYELARAYYLRGLTAVAQRAWGRAREAVARAAELCLALADEPLGSRVMAVQARVAEMTGEPAKALSRLDTAVEQARQSGDPLALGQILLWQSEILLRRGRPEKAVQAADDAAALLGRLSQNLWAQALACRGAAYIYLGQTAAAEGDLTLAADLLAEMDDPAALALVYLLWGYEYGRLVQNWPEMLSRLGRVEKMLAEHLPQEYAAEAWIRLYLGQSLASGQENLAEQAKERLCQAEELALAAQANWWLPAIFAQCGELELAAGAVEAAYEQFSRALVAVHEGGCPDDLPLILLRLAQLTREQDKNRLHFYETAVAAAHERSRYLDKVVVFREAGEVLMGVEGDGRMRRIGEGCLSWVAEQERGDQG